MANCALATLYALGRMVFVRCLFPSRRKSVPKLTLSTGPQDLDLSSLLKRFLLHDIGSVLLLQCWAARVGDRRFDVVYNICQASMGKICPSSDIPIYSRRLARAFLTSERGSLYMCFGASADPRFSVDAPSLLEISPSFSMSVEYFNQDNEPLNKLGLVVNEQCIKLISHPLFLVLLILKIKDQPSARNLDRCWIFEHPYQGGNL